MYNIKKYLSTLILISLLLVIAIASLFVGVIDIDLNSLLMGETGMELNIFLLARIPRLLAILCTGVGMSVAGLIMQQLCMNKFVSPSTGATIQSAQFGILLSLVFIPTLGLWGRVLLAFAMAIIGTWIFGVPLGFFAAYYLNQSIVGVYLILSFEEVIRLIISIIIFRQKKWMYGKIQV